MSGAASASASSAASGAAATTRTAGPVTILICALGGEGGGVLSEWLVDAAAHAGYAAQSTSIPGVAQRTGATTYYVEIFPVPIEQLDGRRPVFSLYPVPGALDLLASSELLETVRQVGNGMSSATRTRIVTSSARTLTTNERMQLGDGRVPEERLLDVVRQSSAQAQVLDMSALTREAGTVVSAVMFGAIAASGALPFAREACEEAIRAGGKGAEASLRGFVLAYDHRRARTDTTARAPGDAHATSSRDGRSPRSGEPGGAAPEMATPGMATTGTALPPEVASLFPTETHPLIALGYARVREYQDPAYAALYVERLQRVLAAERTADPGAGRAYALTGEVARYLALWMAFDDIVRVAELKSRASRAARVAREVGVRGDDLLRVFDHFKPGIPEIAALLPAHAAGALMRWDRRWQARGRAPLAWPVKLGTHTVFGAFVLRILGRLKGVRRAGTRYALEQALIERWLGAIERGTRAGWTLGHELARCGRLIKGYGSTNERGRDNLLHIVDHLAVMAGATNDAATAAAADARADAVRSAREAALADEAGTALDRTLAAHGAPPRPVKAVPIRFVRKPQAQAVANRD